MIIDEPKERKILIEHLRLPIEVLVHVSKKDKDYPYCLVKIYGKNPSKEEQKNDEPYATIEASYDDEKGCLDYHWESLTINWQKIVKDYEGELQKAICKGHELYNMYDIMLRSCEAYKMVITDLKGKSLGLCNYEFVDGAWSCRVDYGSQSNNGIDKGARPIANRSKRRNRMRSEQPYISQPTPNPNPQSEKEVMLSAVTKEQQMKLEHQKIMKAKELHYSDILHRRNIYYKGGLSVLFIAALIVSFFTDNIDVTAPMVGVLLGAIFASVK